MKRRAIPPPDAALRLSSARREYCLDRRDFVRLASLGVAGGVSSCQSVLAVGVHATTKARRIDLLANGVEIWQVTDTPGTKDNIYCERSYCTPDSRFFVFQRDVEGPCPLPNHRMVEFVVCEFGTWQLRVLGRGYSYGEIAPKGAFLFLRPGADGATELVRAQIASGRCEVVVRDSGIRPLTGMSVSFDGRQLAYGVSVSYGPQMFGVEVLDLATGRRRRLFQDPFICNPHEQIEPGRGEVILIQQNRGCEYTADGAVVRWLGKEGCTLLRVRLADGQAEQLRVGPPHTASCTGHQSWIGTSGEVLLTVNTPFDDGKRQGNLLAVRSGQAPRVVAGGGHHAHVHASACGRLFCTDRVNRTASPMYFEVVIGSVATGRSAALFSLPVPAPEIRRKFGQSSDIHPYLSPDACWVVVNDVRSGVPQVCVASIPERIVKEVLQ
jgi:hypothetical protein